MATGEAAGTAAGSHRQSYEEFEPFCKWGKVEQHDILQIRLEGFKKDQLRVRVSSAGRLTVTGERQLDGNRWTRFWKETDIPKNSKANEIRAKFSSGVLYITIPKKAPQEQLNSTPVPQETNIDKVTTIAEADERKTKTAATLTSRLKVSPRTAVKVAAGVSVVVLVSTLLAYLVVKYWQRDPNLE